MLSCEDHTVAAVVRLAHGKVSALDIEFCDALSQELNRLASSSTPAVILTGTGSAFSAGVDLFRVLDGGRAYLHRFLPAMETLFRTLLTFPRPLIAAVNGHAIAGGCIIAATSDHRLMADTNGRIGIPELLVGVPFPTLPFEIVRARVSRAQFRALVLGGKTVLPSEAVTLGLIDEVVPAGELLPRALETAERLMQIPSIAFALTKRAFVEPILARVDAGRSFNDEVLSAWESPAVQDRMRLYVERTVAKK
jgi:enoyl-CoA hydratase